MPPLDQTHAMLGLEHHHFPLISEEEYKELRRQGVLGDAEEIIPAYKRWPHTKRFQGNKEKALEFTQDYLKTLEIKCN